MKYGMRLVSLTVLALWAAGASAPAQGGLFTSCNIWYEKPANVPSTLYKTGAILPAGTAVSRVAVSTGAKGLLKGKPVIVFTTAPDQVQYTISFVAKHHPGVTPEAFKERLFGTKDFEALTAGMSALEVQAIRDGKIKVGMSKKAVLVSYGPPPQHETPSETSNAWKYWMNRFVTKTISFDAQGRTVRAPSEAPDDL